MSYMIKNLKQTILYWGNPTAIGVGYSYANAVEILGRWEDRQEIFVDVNGREQKSQAIVYLKQDVKIGGYLYLGSLDDLGDSSSALDISDPSAVDAWEIKAFKKIPNLRATDWERKAWL